MQRGSKVWYKDDYNMHEKEYYKVQIYVNHVH